jgi:ABC-type transport system involved in multi-copper enzyme maturation permease subunit
MLLAIPFMAVCLYIWPHYAPWYICYVVMFNMLVGPVFSAGSVTSERERQTLDLLLTTIISPWQILWGKLVSGLRVSSVLTAFLLWPVLLACLAPVGFWSNLPSMACYFLIVGLTCLTTATLALFCSVMFRKTSISLMTTYLLIVLLFTAPLAVRFFAQTFFPSQSTAGAKESATEVVRPLMMTSPFAAAFSVPLRFEAAAWYRSDESRFGPQVIADWPLFWSYVGFTCLFDAALAGLMIWLFNTRWRVSE